MSGIAEWAARFVGIPFRDGGRDFDGCDCYGLFRLAYQEVYSISLPSYTGAYTSAQERDEVAALLTSRIPADAWQAITGAPRVGDAVVFRVLGQPWHCGVMVSPTDFLHVASTTGLSRIERLDAWAWARRRHGVYRHPRLA